MAFNQLIAFEVDKATGNDANGGGFDDTSGTPGTNYAWGAGQTTIAYTDLATVGVSAVVTSVARAFIAADVGNVVNITAGTNFTTGRYQILSVSAGAATLDRNATTGVGAGGTGTLGGSLLTIQTGINAAFINTGAVADCRVYIKKGAYVGTVALLTTASVAAVKYKCRVIGYNATHNDIPTIASGNQPTYAVGSGAGVNGIDISTQTGYSIENITFDGTVSSGTAGVKGVNLTALYNRIINCKIMNFSAEGFISSAGGTSLFNSEVTGCAGTNSAVQIPQSANGSSLIAYNWIHKNTKTAISTVFGQTIAYNIISNNSGASSDGISGDIFGTTIFGNVFYNNGRDGIRATNAYDATISSLWLNNIFAKNGGVGINLLTALPPPTNSLVSVNYNAFYSNTGGNYNNMTASANDVSVAINPFVSSDANLASETSPNWALNNTANAGASLRAAGFFGTLSALSTTTGFQDIGAFQHQDSGGGTTTNIFVIED